MNCSNCSANSCYPKKNALTYSVYETGGVVKAELSGTHYDAFNTIDRLCRRADMKTISLNGITADMFMDYSYRGRAKVNKVDGDKFNEEIGRELARGKALHKYHKAYDKRICAFLADVRTLLATIEHYCAKKSIDISKVDSVEDIHKKRFGSC